MLFQFFVFVVLQPDFDRTTNATKPEIVHNNQSSTWMGNNNPLATIYCWCYCCRLLFRADLYCCWLYRLRAILCTANRTNAVCGLSQDVAVAVKANLMRTTLRNHMSAWWPVGVADGAAPRLHNRGASGTGSTLLCELIKFGVGRRHLFWMVFWLGLTLYLYKDVISIFFSLQYSASPKSFAFVQYPLKY